MPKTTTKKKKAESKDVAQADLKARVEALEEKIVELEAKPKVKKKSDSSEADLLQSLSNRLSTLEDKFQRLVVSHRFQF